MGVKSDVEAMWKKLKEEYPDLKAKFQVNSGATRTIDAQVNFIVDRSSEYPTASKDFKSKFKKKIPDKKTITDEERTWLKNYVKKKSEKGEAYFHCSGKAIDVQVSALNTEQKGKFKTMIEKKYKLIMEKPPKYYVSIGTATVFHVQPK